jgi:hypothetical protein
MTDFIAKIALLSVLIGLASIMLSLAACVMVGAYRYLRYGDTP